MRSLLCLLLLAAQPLVHAADKLCDARRPEEIFKALEALDTAGEQRLQGLLKELSKKESWTQNDWEKYTLTLSDDPNVSQNEDRRSSLFAKIFDVLGHRPPDCAALDVIENDILKLEQSQWDAAIHKVEERLGRPGST